MSGNRYVQKVVNGVVTWVPVTAAGLYINDALGNLLNLPGQNQGNNSGNRGSSSGNNPGINSGSSSGNNSGSSSGK